MKHNQARNLRWRYAGIFATALIVIAVVYLYFCWGTQTTILLVRHAEREGSADALSTAGTDRAQVLAHVLEKSGISAIYTSEAIRTLQTAAPTASRFGITPVAVPAADVAGLVSTIRSNNSGQTVLVVGHSNTVPQIIAEFGGPAVIIGENEFDNLYVLTLCSHRWCHRRQTVRLTNLQYGAASP
jgi:broad specificity phosphatase PhoE